MSIGSLKLTEAIPVLSAQDRQQMDEQGITHEQIQSQIQQFKQGIPFTILTRPCVIGNGITALAAVNHQECLESFQEAMAGGRIMKLVPASGAASRMFKSLLLCLEQYESQGKNTGGFRWGRSEQQVMEKFLTNLPSFPFSPTLLACIGQQPHAQSPHDHTQDSDQLLKSLLLPEGLNYAALPKALIPFHQYKDHVRTPLEEHILEAIQYTIDENGKARVHFTISPEHELRITDFVRKAIPQYEQSGMTIEVSFSLQNPSTNTVAVDLDNQLFRDREGKMVFRPGGHGALLENLNDIRGDIIFIKNIDNIVHHHLQATTVRWKKVLAGRLIVIQKAVFQCLKDLTVSQPTSSIVHDACTVAKEYLSLEIPKNFEQWDKPSQTDFLIEKLNRPIRVCGMVKNVGEPGGGPFWVQEENGTSSLQIVENSQVDPHSTTQQKCFRSSTHFNPVDLVCGVRDFQGNPFDLRKFVNPNAGFISKKSFQGTDVQALELPGLWNGAMANWNTIFIEIPLDTFNPVKTVFDLLRPEHQPYSNPSKATEEGFHLRP